MPFIEVIVESEVYDDVRAMLSLSIAHQRKVLTV
jgi:hypothetical protein